MEPILFVTSDGLRRHDPGDDVMLGRGSEPATADEAEAVVRTAPLHRQPELVPDRTPVRVVSVPFVTH